MLNPNYVKFGKSANTQSNQRFVSYRKPFESEYVLQNTGRKFKSIDEMVKFCNLSPGDSLFVAENIDHQNGRAIRVTNESGKLFMQINNEEQKTPYII
jgi:hypothetical protein